MWMKNSTCLAEASTSVWVKEASQTAHRVSWFIHRGHINDDDRIQQTCTNANCVNPEHLELMSKKESARRNRQKSLARQKGSNIKTDLGDIQPDVTPKQKLAVLDSFFEEGLMSEENYNKKRIEILKAM